MPSTRPSAVRKMHPVPSLTYDESVDKGERRVKNEVKKSNGREDGEREKDKNKPLNNMMKGRN